MESTPVSARGRRLLAPLTLIATLTACAGQTNTQSEEQVNLIDLEREAAEAYERRDWQTAERQYRQLLDASPNESEAWFRLGNIYARLDRADDAVNAYRESLLRDSENAKAWNNMGVVQLRQTANTFRELYNHTEPYNPLNARAEQLFRSLTELLEKGPDATGESTSP